MPLDTTAKKTEVILEKNIVITPPRFQRGTIHIRGTAPYMQNKFSQKALDKMEETHRQGSQAKKGSKKSARDFDADWRAAMHVSVEGWPGIPSSGFRAALIDACRMAGFQMTRAKMSIFVEADGYDREDGTPLTKILGAPDEDHKIMPVRNDSGVTDLRCRPIWSVWGCDLNLRWDLDQFSVEDVMNLLARAGVQCGIGEGRPFSKNSNGIGFGTWEIVS